MAPRGEAGAVTRGAPVLGIGGDRGVTCGRDADDARSRRGRAARSCARPRGSGVSVAIVTDSAAALPAELVAKYGITVVPMWLTVRGMPEPEGERPLEQLVVEQDVTTSAPTPGEFETAIKETRASDDGVLVLTIASSMSATHQAALVAARAVGGPVRVVDTQTAGGAEALVVLAAAEAAHEGASLEDRKSTRLNSSHSQISYAVFCLKKKKKKKKKK